MSSRPCRRRRVILEAGVENRIAVGLEVPEGDSGCSEVVGYGFEHDGVFRLNQIVSGVCLGIGRHLVSAQRSHQQASADDVRGLGIESSPVGELDAVLIASADDVHQEQLRCPGLLPPYEDV